MFAAPVLGVYAGGTSRTTADSIRNSVSSGVSSRANTLLYLGNQLGIALIYTVSGWTPALVNNDTYDFGVELISEIP
jgi:hypothetical protein